MVQSVSGNYSAAIIAPDQQIQHKVLIGFPGAVPAVQQDVTDCVVSIMPRRNATTVVDSAISGIAGLATVEMVIKLAGMLPQAVGVQKLEADTIERLFRPNDPASALYRTTRTGLTVTVQIGYPKAAPGEWVTIYTGVVDIPEVADDGVTLTCRDPNDTLNGQASLPPVVTQAGTNVGLTSEWAMDYLARRNTPIAYLTWPALRPFVRCAVSMRTSVWPEVGTFSNQIVLTRVPDFKPGVFGSAVTNQGPVAYNISPILPAESCFVEWFRTDGTATQIVIVSDQPAGGTDIHFRITVTTTNIQISVRATTGSTVTDTWTISTLGSTYISVQYTWAIGSNTCSGLIRMDGSTHSFSINAGVPRLADKLASFVTVYNDGDGTIEGVQVTAETTGSSTPNNGFVQTMFLDPSLNTLVALPDVSGKKVRDVFQDIAGAEGGVFAFDELGVPRFINRATIRAKLPVRTVTSKLSLLQLKTQEQRAYTHLQVPYAALAIQVFQTVWNASGDPIKVNTGATLIVNATTSDSIVSLGTSIVTWSGTAVDGTSGYRAARLKDGSGGAISNLVITVTQTGPKAVQISVRNPNGFPVYLCSPQGTLYPDASDGQPALLINARPVSAKSVIPDTTTTVAAGAFADSQWPPLIDGGAITNAQFGDRLFTVPASDWRQSLGDAQSMGDDMLAELHFPKVVYRDAAMVFDPTLQILDAVTFGDSDVSQTNEAVLLLGIYPQLSASEWSMAVDALALYRPGAWELGVSTLGVDNYLY